MPLQDSAPSVAGDAWVAPSASVIGKVAVSSKASVWYGAVLKGECARKAGAGQGLAPKFWGVVQLFGSIFWCSHRRKIIVNGFFTPGMKFSFEEPLRFDMLGKMFIPRMNRLSPVF